MDLADLHGRLQGFADATTTQQIATLTASFAEDLGYPSFVYALRVPTSLVDSHVVQISGYPDAWLDHYWESSLYAVDPVIAYCSSHVLPTTWRQLVSRMSAANRRMMGEAGEFGLRDGVSMPTHGPRGELGILSFATDGHAKTSPAARRRALITAQLLGSYAHEAVRRVAGASDLGSAATLSEREKECLRWAADGKTSWEIARLFNISERTVNFHFDNTVTKLKASNRQHAVARAIMSRILNPRPF